MELMPALRIGWLNGWIPFVLLVLTEALLLAAFPRDVVKRLLDRSTWNKRQVTFTAIGKAFSLVCIVLIVFAPLKVGSVVFIVGTVLYLLGLAALAAAMLTFRHTPLDQPVTRGLYRISRHPQLMALFVAFLGMCIAVGSWLALIMLLLSRFIQHFSILAEEEACLAQYGESYRIYMQRVPRYFSFY